VTTKGETTRAAILDRALATASEIGLEGLSIGGLAKDVGMSKSGLFGHFQSKEDLQIQVLETAIGRFVARVVTPAFKEPRGLPRLRALLENWLEWSRQPGLPGGCIFIAAANEMDDRPGAVRDRLVAYQRDWIDTLSMAARIAVEEGHLTPDLDTEQFAYDFYALIMGYHLYSRLMRDHDAEARARRSFERLLATSRTA